MLRSRVERLIGSCTADGERTFFDPAAFPWIERLEAGAREIRAELDALLVHRDLIPNFQEISADQARLTEGDQWKTFFLYGYGHKIDANCARCPRTTELLSLIPNMKTAMFSILAPRKHIPEHRGVYKGILRYHLGLVIPEPAEQCRIRVGGDVRSWTFGKSLVFDDSHPHEAWNDSNEQRVVLFVDFLRPLPLPLDLLNRWMVRRISKTPFVLQAIQAARENRPVPDY
jgi:ornithine lipid ester-linked acyl 2-hydroxylase